jgi:hypothetical protein
MLDRSLALRFKSLRGLPRVRTARIWIHMVGARALVITLALCFFSLTIVYELLAIFDLT